MDLVLKAMAHMKRRMTAPVRLLYGLCLTLLAGAAVPAHAAGDIHRGEDVFAQECAECHSVREGKNKKGPSLFAIVGRKAASIGDVVYSDALRQSGLTWNAASLDSYIAAPRKAVPNGKMKYDGLGDAKAREDLVAYLATLH